MNREKENSQMNSLFSRSVGARGYGGYQPASLWGSSATSSSQQFSQGPSPTISSMTMKGSASGQLSKEGVSKFSSWATPTRMDE